MLRRITNLALMLTLLAGIIVINTTAARAQDKNNYTAEQIVETFIVAHGSREALAQIRRNGWERGKIMSVTDDGRTEESTYERRFIRGENFEKDKVRLDQKTPTQEYALVYTDGKTFGLIKDSSFTPRENAATSFLSHMWHGIEALLRYKENGSTITLFGKDKQLNIDLYVIDLVDKEKRRTRYYLSQKTFRVLWLKYEEPAAGGTSVKYMRKFYDYQVIQSTLLPKRTLFFVDGKQKEEVRVLSVTYGIKMDDTLFKNPEAQTSAVKP